MSDPYDDFADRIIAYMETRTVPYATWQDAAREAVRLVLGDAWYEARNLLSNRERDRLRDALAALEAENALLRGGRDEAERELTGAARKLADEWEESKPGAADARTISEHLRQADEWDMRGRPPREPDDPRRFRGVDSW